MIDQRGQPSLSAVRASSPSRYSAEVAICCRRDPSVNGGLPWHARQRAAWEALKQQEEHCS